MQSAFAKAFGDEVIVKKYSDGTSKAVATLQHMEVNMGTKYEANITSVTGATVLSTKNESSTKFNGNVETVEVPEKIEFDLNLDANNKQVLEINVDFLDEMSGSSHPMDITLELSMDEKVELTDKELLKATIDEANKVYEKENVTQKEIDEATQKLKNAISYLVRNIDEGTYTINGSFVKENSDEESMANKALKNVVMKVNGDQTYVELEAQPMSMYCMTAAIEKLEIQSAAGDHYEEAQVLATDENGALLNLDLYSH